MAREKLSKEPVDVDFTLRRVFGKKSFRLEAIVVSSNFLMLISRGLYSVK